jgi:hypothetical protein
MSTNQYSIPYLLIQHICGELTESEQQALVKEQESSIFLKKVSDPSYLKQALTKMDYFVKDLENGKQRVREKIEWNKKSQGSEDEQ